MVLGAGGVLGFAWTVGALRVLEDERGVDIRDSEVCVGTSAGAILAALVGSGVSSEAIVRHQFGTPEPDDPAIVWDYDASGGPALPLRPALGLGSPRLALRVLRHPRRVTPMTALSSVLPPGRGRLDAVGRMIEGLCPAGEPWPARPSLRIIAMDYEVGRRIPFGAEGGPAASLSAAVSASCAIPGWYSPVVIDGRRYVDGGMCSPTSVDLLATRDLDEVYVLAPMTSLAYDQPRSLPARVERRFRRAATARMLREVAKVRAAGAAVTVLAPGPEDLEAIGANLMNPRRRRAVLRTALHTTAQALRAEPTAS